MSSGQFHKTPNASHHYATLNTYCTLAKTYTCSMIASHTKAVSY